MAQQLKRLAFVPDANSDLETLIVLPDHRDLFKLRGFVADRGWPENMVDDPIRQTYAMGWLAARRLGLISPQVKFDDFWPAYDIQDPDADDDGNSASTLEVGPTQPTASGI